MWRCPNLAEEPEDWVSSIKKQNSRVNLDEVENGNLAFRVCSSLNVSNTKTLVVAELRLMPKSI